MLALEAFPLHATELLCLLLSAFLVQKSAERMIIAECRKGEEITHTYNMDNERNDYAALNYFFIQRLDPPRLCSIDLPEGHLDASFPEFDDHYLPRDKAAILVRSFTSHYNRERIQRQIFILEVRRPVHDCQP